MHSNFITIKTIALASASLGNQFSITSLPPS